VWLNGSDNPPPADVERVYLDIEKELQWPNPIVSSASEQKAAVSGESGVKMTGPYEYVPPVYWLADTQAGRRLWVQYRDESRAGDSANRIVGEIHSQRASLAYRRRLGIITQVVNVSRPSMFYRWLDSPLRAGNFSR